MLDLLFILFLVPTYFNTLEIYEYIRDFHFNQ